MAVYKIVTVYEHPPFPTRSTDWRAYFDYQEESGPYGWGPTEEQAMIDLIHNYELPPGGTE